MNDLSLRSGARLSEMERRKNCKRRCDDRIRGNKIHSGDENQGLRTILGKYPLSIIDVSVDIYLTYAFHNIIILRDMYKLYSIPLNAKKEINLLPVVCLIEAIRYLTLRCTG